jgi:hypothetical protein
VDDVAVAVAWRHRGSGSVNSVNSGSVNSGSVNTGSVNTSGSGSVNTNTNSGSVNTNTDSGSGTNSGSVNTNTGSGNSGSGRRRVSFHPNLVRIQFYELDASETRGEKSAKSASFSEREMEIEKAKKRAELERLFVRKKNTKKTPKKHRKTWKTPKKHRKNTEKHRKRM